MSCLCFAQIPVRDEMEEECQLMDLAEVAAETCPLPLVATAAITKPLSSALSRPSDESDGMGEDLSSAFLPPLPPAAAAIVSAPPPADTVVPLVPSSASAIIVSELLLQVKQLSQKVEIQGKLLQQLLLPPPISPSEQAAKSTNPSKALGINGHILISKEEITKQLREKKEKKEAEAAAKADRKRKREEKKEEKEAAKRQKKPPLFKPKSAQKSARTSALPVAAARTSALPVPAAHTSALPVPVAAAAYQAELSSEMQVEQSSTSARPRRAAAVNHRFCKHK